MMCNRQTTTNHRYSIPHVVFLFRLTFFGIVFFGLIHGTGIGWSRTDARMLPQSEPEIASDATPQIQQVTPNEARAGSEVTVVIDGRNFSSGVYISFSDPTIKVISARRASATQLETKLAIGKNAQPDRVTLYARNPTSTAAESCFTIVASAPPPATAAATVVSSPPIPDTDISPAGATPRATPPSDIQPTDAGVPVVTKVAPPSAGRGSALTLKISGKNFAPGARLAFSNPGIQVLETRVRKTTELTASIQIASEAAVGATNMFVVNPDDREAEASFSVTDASPTIQPAATSDSGTASAKQPAKTTPTTAGASLTGQRFDVYNLGDGIAVFQNPSKSRGTLVLTKGKLKYEEGGNEMFSASLKDIQEVDQNSVFGVKTGTLHIMLKSGKSYNFIAASLHATDTQAIVDSLRAALK